MYQTGSGCYVVVPWHGTLTSVLDDSPSSAIFSNHLQHCQASSTLTMLGDKRGVGGLLQQQRDVLESVACSNEL